MSHKRLKVLTGFNEGAELELDPGAPVILGSHSDCSLVLIDETIADRHCQFILTVAGLMCTALNGKLTLGDKELSPGETVKINDLHPIKCGDVVLAAGENNVDWNVMQSTNDQSTTGFRNQFLKMPERKRNLLIGAIAILLVIIGFGLASLFSSSSKISQSYVDEARAWLKTIAPAGSELQLNQAKNNQLVLSGYVATNYQNELLLMTVNNSIYRPKIEVYSIEQMLSSMSRLANLEGIPCVVAYLHDGHLACTNKVESADHENRLRVLAQQIAGVKGIEVNANAIAPANEIVTSVKEPELAPAQPKTEATNTITNFARKLYILISDRGRFVIDSNGYKSAEGDVIDGFTLTSIELDQVKLERNGQRYLVSVGAMR